MKKGLILLSTIALSFFIAHNANAAAYTQDGTTFEVEVDTANVSGAGGAGSTITFAASSQVTITGVSEAQVYAHGAHNLNAAGKKNGRQFAMHSDRAKVYWQDIETAANVEAVDNTDFATEFSGWEAQ